MWVENRSDDLRVGVKGQSSSEIAGSPRNIFLVWPFGIESAGGRALDGSGWLITIPPPNQTPNA